MTRRALSGICVLFAGLLFLQSCDYVKPPELIAPIDSIPDTNAVVQKRIILLEDYTGLTCGHCPKAADAANQALSLYREQVVALAVHSGSFANPQPPSYPEDFRTPVGDELNTFFGISAVGNPNGMVNRAGKPADEHVIAYPTWNAKVAEELAKPFTVWINVFPEYNPATRQSEITVKTEFKAPMQGEYKLACYIAEDSIIGNQKDYRKSPSHVTNFVHRHVLRGSYNNSAWGELIAANPPASSATIDRNYSATLPAAWDAKHCYAVVFVYNADTYEVIQAREVKVIP